MVRTQSNRRPVTSRWLAAGRQSAINHRRPVTGRRAMTVRRLTASCLILAAAGIAACSTSHNQAGASPSAADASVSAAVTASAANRTPPPLSSEAADAVAALSPQERALRDAALAAPEPQRPARADQHDLTGAIAAAQYFITLYPYVYATGDLTAFRAMSDATCKFCDSVITSATNMHTSGGWADPWGQQITFTSITADVSTPNRYVVELHLVSDQHVAHNTGKSPVTVEAFEVAVLVQVLWKDGTGWIVEEATTQ